jgi:1-aminocyclopropane-1-carboxylate deaminase/D-cysteine desulfhydrase-like pyridoxal-dependent ACC family enzyme
MANEDLPVTPISRAGPLWVKRDDLTSETYGGNKVRKLRLLLADAERQGKRRILTVGAAGSHHVLATTLFAAARGMEVTAVLVPQYATPHVEANLRAGLRAGLVPIAARSYLEVPYRLWRARTRETYMVPLGGSSALGSLGYVEAAAELAQQIERGALPMPATVVVALGSGGTVAGLAVGFAELGLPVRIAAVAISKPVFALKFLVSRLIRATAATRVNAAALAQSALRRVDVISSQVGRGYGYPTAAGALAVANAAAHDLRLDPTYTAKAYAYAERCAQQQPGPVLFWHTLSRAFPKQPEAAAADALPPALQRLLIL